MHKKSGLCAVLALVLAFGGAGCSNMVGVNAEKDNAQVVAVVNGTEIPKEQYYAMIDTVSSSYGLTDEDLTDGDNAAEMRDYVLDQVVREELMYQQAVEEGLVDESDEHKQEVRKELEDMLEEQKDFFYSSYEDEDAAEASFQEFLVANGYDDLDAMVDKQIRTDAVNSLYEEITDPVSVSDEEARAYYDQQVEQQKAAIDEDPSTYSLYTSMGYNYYNPAGSNYVKNLLIALPDDVQSEISSLRAAGDEEAADELRDEELAKIRDAAQAALDRLNDGEDIDDLIAELGEDPGMTSEPAATYGYMVYDGSDYVEEFETAALALNKDGENSGLVGTDFGYHIIYRVADASGAVPYEMVEDHIIESETNTKQSNAYEDYIKELKEDTDIVLFTERLDVYR